MSDLHRHLVIGLSGTALTDGERRWLHDAPPLGIILFARNIETPAQVSALLSEVRHCTGQPTWAAIDEEGGRVNRMPWPPFSDRRPAAEFGCLYRDNPEAARQAVCDDAHTVGCALKELGFTHDCAPVLDVFHATADAIIGERAYASDINVVSDLGAACIQGLHAAGIEAVGKHFPGHGRADSDSHLAVPHVKASLGALLEETATFKFCIEQGLRHIMTAHVAYEKADTNVATLSEFWLKDVLRQRFDFQGGIWSDDLCMKGVGSDVGSAVTQALNAGCNVLLICEPCSVQDIFYARR